MCREDAPDGAHGRAGRPPSLPIESGPGRQIDAVAGCERPCATSAPQEPLPFGNASCPSPGRPVTLSAFGQLAPSEVRCQRHRNRCLSATLPAPAQAVLSPCRHSASLRRPKSAASATGTVAFRQRFLPQPRPSCHPVGIRPACAVRSPLPAPQEPLPFGNASCPSPGRPVTLSAFGQLAPSEVRQAARQIQSETLPGVFHGLDVERRAARRRLRRARRTVRAGGRLNEEPSGCGSRAGAHDGVNAPDYTPPPGARQARDTDLSGGGSADG